MLLFFQLKNVAGAGGEIGDPAIRIVRRKERDFVRQMTLNTAKELKEIVFKYKERNALIKNAMVIEMTDDYARVLGL